jgi:hypothetical protein
MHHRNDPSRRSLMILGAHEVAAQLEGRERELIDLAAQAYVTHGRGDSRLPQSEYLRFPGLASSGSLHSPTTWRVACRVPRP